MMPNTSSFMELIISVLFITLTVMWSLKSNPMDVETEISFGLYIVLNNNGLARYKNERFIILIFGYKVKKRMERLKPTQANVPYSRKDGDGSAADFVPLLDY
uniref:Uncharacterized protein n=1 Tax=Glossina austeni TaxID=7395 RepID=A0A1A9UUC2_GLOAU